MYLLLQSYRQMSLVARHNIKLSPWFYGPYQVLKRVRTVAYQLNLPHSSKIQLVFHVSCLKKKLIDRILPLPTLPPIDKNGEIQPELKLIVDQCMRNIANRFVTKVLVK